MAAFIIADVDIRDAEAYKEYLPKARALAEKHGGRYRARGGELDVVDSELWTPTRLVIIEFPDMQSAQAFARSDDYAPVAAIRHANSKSTVVIVDGID
ncbi:MAG: DUF1330 domain-containing protein [Zhengella sp.]|uniref:DUF1330 domain-containing protein n=1 Tax=Zhengella sp. TaxID=2282762 RepID=UPI003528624E|nr:DUF1330 domain-containing protein [Brucellaceae bacterium]